MKKTETQIFENIRSYFNSLGYPDSTYMVEVDINSEDIIASKKRVDFSIAINNIIHIVVEIKTGEISDKLSTESIKYDPIVRQAQRYSHDINARYFVITNGTKYLWFTTGSDGRPTQIQPITYDNMPISMGEPIDIEREFHQALKMCMQILWQNNVSNNMETDLLFILVAKYYMDNDEIFDINNSDEVSARVKFILQRYLSESHIVSMFSADKKCVVDCIHVLGHINLPNLPVNIAADAFEDIFHSPFKNGNYRIPKSLCIQMLSLIPKLNKAYVLDPWANYSDFMRLYKMNSPYTKFSVICTTGEAWLYNVFMELLASGTADNVHLLSKTNLFDRSFMLNKFGNADAIITAFPFGLRVTRNIDIESQFSYIEDYLLDLSINLLAFSGRLIALVPEGLLFNGGKRLHFRRHLISTYSLRAIISLPNAALSSNVKSSVIVIDKSKEHENDVFMGAINDAGNASINHNDIDNVNYTSIFESLHEFLNKGTIINDIKSAVMVPENELHENLSVTSYLANQSPHLAWANTVKLSEVCHDIRKGKAIRLNSDGKFAVLGPASIRPLTVEKAAFDKADILPDNSIFANFNDVVINNIGKYLGAAAIVHNNNMPISQHVYVLTPNTTVIIPEYLAIALNNSSVQEHLRQAATGSIMPSIRLSFLRDTLLPLPSIDKQRQIVNALRKQQGEIEFLNTKLSEAYSALKKIIDTLDIEEGY